MTRVVGVIAALVLAAGCAGRQAAPDPRGPAPGYPAAEAPLPPSDESGVPPERYDEYEQTFRMKQPSVARCMSDAVAAGTAEKKAGQVTVLAKIAADGHLSEVSVSRSTLGLKNVEDCIVALVKGWVLSAPGQPAEFSFTYVFQAE